jgi:hypothetical protein
MALSFDALVISVLGGIGTGLVGIATLAIQSRYSENTKQLTSTLLELEKMTDQCSKFADAVWSVEGNPNSEEVAETICALHDIGAYVNFITSKVRNSNLRLSSALINYRSATSGDDFDVKGRPPTPERKLQIRSAAVALKIAFREVDFERKHFHLPFVSY